MHKSAKLDLSKECKFETRLERCQLCYAIELGFQKRYQRWNERVILILDWDFGRANCNVKVSEKLMTVVCLTWYLSRRSLWFGLSNLDRKSVKVLVKLQKPCVGEVSPVFRLDNNVVTTLFTRNFDIQVTEVLDQVWQSDLYCLIGYFEADDLYWSHKGKKPFVVVPCTLIFGFSEESMLQHFQILLDPFERKDIARFYISI